MLLDSLWPMKLSWSWSTGACGEDAVGSNPDLDVKSCHGSTIYGRSVSLYFTVIRVFLLSVLGLGGSRKRLGKINGGPRGQTQVMDDCIHAIR